MPGKIVHTNEVLVMLGDNWFVDRSAVQAAEIVDRRMECKHFVSHMYILYLCKL
jgi:prefoldin subunit 5